ncbi:hypothetical protein D2Q93_13930 [Alicyclobacillaceae bacterium I2511]|nr:hypothetical protein D2Q93_13930 [Alicyclobacillaceae bacterium I2511]
MQSLARGMEVRFRVEGMDSATGSRVGRVVDFSPGVAKFLVEATMPVRGMPSARYLCWFESDGTIVGKLAK